MVAKKVAARLRAIGAPQKTLAALLDVSESQLSLWFAGERDLPARAEDGLPRVLAFMEGVHEESDLPVDFANVAELRPHWERYRDEHAPAKG